MNQVDVHAQDWTDAMSSHDYRETWLVEAGWQPVDDRFSALFFRWENGDKITRSRDDKFHRTDHGGISWDEAPIPPRLHDCWPQTDAWTNYFSQIQRCPCGAARVSAYEGWVKRNSRRGQGAAEGSKLRYTDPAPKFWLRRILTLIKGHGDRLFFLAALAGLYALIFASYALLGGQS